MSFFDIVASNVNVCREYYFHIEAICQLQFKVTNKSIERFPYTQIFDICTNIEVAKFLVSTSGFDEECWSRFMYTKNPSQQVFLYVFNQGIKRGYKMVLDMFDATRCETIFFDSARRS